MKSIGALRDLTSLPDLARRLSSQERAIANARAGATELSRQRVASIELEHFLADLPAGKSPRSA